MLYIWMPEAEGTWCWSNGSAWQSVASLEQLIQQLQNDQLGRKSTVKPEDVVVFFPSQHAQMLSQPMLKAQYKQLAGGGIKYLLEDYTTLPIDQMQVRHSFVAPDQVHLLGVAQYDVETWRQALSLLPVKLVALLPDFLLLPAPTTPHHIVLAELQGRLLARQGLLQGQRVDDLELFLQFQTPDVAVLSTGLNVKQQQQLTEHTGQALQQFDYAFDPTGLNKQHPFNVLPKVQQQRHWSRYWTACAALLLAIIVVQLSYDVLRYAKLKNVADQTAAQAIQQYKTWFGANSRVTEQNLKSQFQSQLQLSKSGNNQALDLLSRVGPILMQKQIVAQEVRFDASALSLLLKAKSSDELQALNQQLNQQGFRSQLGNIQADGGTAMGLLRLE